ncbi:MAG: ATP-binding protein [Candidatus Nitricoxidivorans perseverans]|uniref:histidine kinase n=1 Tax=Candidatus Nitricoxidivorans perseverans TaxID=2975601 RepID=A0AA49FJD4_9PROT|nr:MAG: ATP-binding protein [Candidatus Nitricoxidivorans perseverans]
MTAALAIVAALGAMLLFLLATASANTALFASHYPWLLAFNALAAFVLVVLVGIRLRKLRREYRQGVFGSRLKTRLLVMLALMAVLPGALVYAVSMQFAVKSIDSWFDVRVDSALEGGLELGRSVLDAQQKELLEKARDMALDISDTAAGPALANRLREQAGVRTLTLVTLSGHVLAHSADGTNANDLLPDLPPPSQLRLAQQGRGMAAIEGDPASGLLLRALAPVGSSGIGGNFGGFGVEPRILQLTRPVPAAVTRNAASVEAAWRDYQELQLGRAGLKRIYSLTLTFTLLLALFAAIALSFFLAERLARPLLILAEGTRAVAAGDFTPRATLETDDELGVLTRSFNAMTVQLDQARAEREAFMRAAAWAEVAKRVAHEIKNPLMPIQLSADRLQRKLADKLAPEDREMLERSTRTIVNQVESMKAMVNEFRDYARLPPPVPAPLDANVVVREVLDLYGSNGVRIGAVLAEDLPMALADAGQLRQVLHNLVKNAKESLAEHPPAPPAAPEITVSTRAGAGRVIVSVADNGGGFPPEILARAFEPYVTHKAKGTGLGLAIVKKIVDEHRGEVLLSNREGGGAEVTVRLPSAE